MSRRATRRTPKRPPCKMLSRYTPKGDVHFLQQARAFAESGGVVLVSRFRAPTYSVVRNGERWLTRGDADQPLGTFESIERAVAAGDQYDDDEDPFYDPRGAA